MFGEIKPMVTVCTCKPGFPGVSLTIKVFASLPSVASDTPMGTTTTSLVGKGATTNHPAQGRLLASWPGLSALVEGDAGPPWGW